MIARATTAPWSIRQRLLRTLVLGSLLWGCAVAAVVWGVVRSEVDEFLDNTLQESAEILYGLLDLHAGQLPLNDATAPGALAAPPHNERLVWQLVDRDGRVRLRSHRAPDQALSAPSQLGFATGGSGAQWRVYAMRLGAGQAPDTAGLRLLVAQAVSSRNEARLEASVLVVFATLAVGLACALWLRRRVDRELAPLAELSGAVQHFDPLRGTGALPPQACTELAPLRDAVVELGDRLARRVANERAFTAHAAHALRTPLAGMDSQLAVALQACPDDLRPRLLRSRESLSRLRRVVNALLMMFRSGAEPSWERISLDEILFSLPFDGLDLICPPGAHLQVDPDLLAAALLNLLDNAQRHGASQVVVTLQRADAESPGRVWLHLHDNGVGLAEPERQRLQSLLDAQDYASLGGLGLMLADLVARAHGGVLRLLPVERGCAIQFGLMQPATDETVALR